MPCHVIQSSTYRLHDRMDLLLLSGFAFRYFIKKEENCGVSFAEIPILIRIRLPVIHQRQNKPLKITFGFLTATTVPAAPCACLDRHQGLRLAGDHFNQWVIQTYHRCHWKLSCGDFRPSHCCFHHPGPGMCLGTAMLLPGRAPRLGEAARVLSPAPALPGRAGLDRTCHTTPYQSVLLSSPPTFSHNKSACFWGSDN